MRVSPVRARPRPPGQAPAHPRARSPAEWEGAGRGSCPPAPSPLPEAGAGRKKGACLPGREPRGGGVGRRGHPGRRPGAGPRPRGCVRRAGAGETQGGRQGPPLAGGSAWAGWGVAEGCWVRNLGQEQESVREDLLSFLCKGRGLRPRQPWVARRRPERGRRKQSRPPVALLQALPGVDQAGGLALHLRPPRAVEPWQLRLVPRPALC